ncbi:protein chibby homolog 1 [Microplitis demolitor]|uniref:protein chibby homolog 1 n=1 Tax=Microplitis demolitor TaxID=69319 RepID=UPI0004CD9FB9|nr:protein chibby homolog 1 [Microplitis demolitor]
MPFFTNKFSPKKTPLRKAPTSLANRDLSPKRIERELGPEIGPIKIRLGDHEAVFDGGTWIPDSGKIGGTYKENEKLKKEIRKLEEENNFLRLKFDLMLDMLTETTAQVQINKDKVENLKIKTSYNKRTAT